VRVRGDGERALPLLGQGEEVDRLREDLLDQRVRHPVIRQQEESRFATGRFRVGTRFGVVGLLGQVDQRIRS
jgi:hypothetical protein